MSLLRLLLVVVTSLVLIHCTQLCYGLVININQEEMLVSLMMSIMTEVGMMQFSVAQLETLPVTLY